MVVHADLALSRRLEQAEGQACARFAETRHRLFASSGAEWIQCGGAYAVFDGVDSPLTESIGLGLFEELTDSNLDAISCFFLGRGAPADHEISPLVGTAALELLCNRGYRPIEISNVLYRTLEKPCLPEPGGRISVRLTAPHEAQLWAEISTRGWSHENPELRDFLSSLSLVSASSEGSFCFLAFYGGTPGAAGALCMHNGVALFTGSATVPGMRGLGLHTALVEARLRFACENGCDVAMMAAPPGADSQRNFERRGFRIAYTRTRWRLSYPPAVLGAAQEHPETAPLT